MSFRRTRQGSRYVKSDSNAIAWMSRPVEKKTTKTKRAKNKDVIHTSFVTMAEYCDDEFWAEIFKKCSIGTFPKDFDYKNGEMYHRHKNRLAVYQDLSRGQKQIRGFFMEMGNIMSPHDIELAQIETEEKQRNADTSVSLTWSDVTTARGKEIMISRFVNRLLPTPQNHHSVRSRTFDAIKNAITLGFIESGDIILSDGQIACVKGLMFNLETGEYEIEKSLRIYKPPKEKTVTIKYPHSYIGDFSKLCKKKKIVIEDEQISTPTTLDNDTDIDSGSVGWDPDDEIEDLL